MQLWNLYAKYYDLLRSNPVSKALLQQEIQSIQKLISLRTPSSANGVALDLGTGRGICLPYIPSDIVKVFALDKSAEMASITSKKYQQVEVSVGDACHTQYESNSMDLVLCIGVSEYIRDMDELLAEIKRLLRESGYVILTASPPNLINQLRKLFGHPLYLRTQENVNEFSLRHDLKLLSLNSTAIQDQFLLINVSSESL